MNNQTIQTVIRHLKGITSALEKSLEDKKDLPEIITYNGVDIKDISDSTLLEAYVSTFDAYSIIGGRDFSQERKEVRLELERRGIDVQTETITKKIKEMYNI